MSLDLQQPRTRLPRWKLALITVGASLLLAGCASNPPDEQLAVSQQAVDSAFSSGAPEFATVEMKSAQDKLKQAELAMQEENYQEARRLAEQAEWDARLAERKARAAKAEKILQDAQQGIQQLREESLRSVQPAGEATP
nr:DUF4398 domain-containing protein [uncultured Pseudomonas sp.]